MTTALEGGEESASRPGRSLPPGKTRYPLYRRLSGPQGRSEQVRKISPPTGIRSPDHPARSQSLYRLSYPAGLLKALLNKSNPGWLSKFSDPTTIWTIPCSNPDKKARFFSSPKSPRQAPDSSNPHIHWAG